MTGPRMKHLEPKRMDDGTLECGIFNLPGLRAPPKRMLATMPVSRAVTYATVRDMKRGS